MNQLHYGRGRRLAILVPAFIALAAACSGSPGGTGVVSSGSSQNPTTGAASGAGSLSGSVSPSSGVSASAGATTGSVSSGSTVTSGSTASGTVIATSGDTGTTSGGSGSATSSGAASGASAGAASGASSGTAVASGGNTDTLPVGKSAGCGNAPSAMDVSGKFVMHNIMVTGVDPAFVTAHPPQPPGSWTDRVYYLDLPSNYDPTKAYPLLLSGNGCGGAVITNGSNGGDPRVLPEANSQAILIGLSYLWPKGGGACFAEGYADTPDLPYFDSILAEVESNYCVDRGNVFVSGYSSGGWESYMLGFARGGTVIRGIATAAGGIHPMTSRPPDSGKAMAAILLTGATDTTNPATGATGSMAARDFVLQTNGCVGTATTPWSTLMGGNCQQYTGCPTDYPVIYCLSSETGHTDGGGNYPAAIWSFWSGLPAVP